MAERTPNLPAAEAFGLTQRQSLFWVERKLFPGVPLHNVALTVELDGPLDEDRLADAYRNAVARLDFLRLFVDDAEPRQWIVDAEPPALERIDLSETPQSFDSWLGTRSLASFTFPGWLHSAAIVQLGPERHVFYLLLHHICADGTSALRFVDYLAELYRGREPLVRSSFREYVAYEAAYRASPKHARDAKYWTEKVGAGVRSLRFYARPRSARSAAIERIWHDYGSERRARLESLIEREEFELLSPAMSRLGVLSTLVFAFMHRISENRDLVIATPVENRGADFQDTFGLLMEQAFLKVEVDEAETFRSLFEKVRKDLGRTFRHAQYCVSERGLDFASLNLLTPRPGAFAELRTHVRLQGALTLRGPMAGFDTGLRNTFGIQIHDAESAGGFRVGFDLHAETFAPRQRERMIEHVQRLLDAFLEDPDQRIDSVNLVGPQEQVEILALARGPEPKLAQDLVERIAWQCARQPEKIAVSGPSERLTYAQLWARVSRFARRLVELGIGAESRVAVSLPRGTEELATLLAILVAGGAYVPLDPTQPIERLRMIIEDSQPSLLVTQAGLPLEGEEHGLRRILFDDEKAQLERFEPTPPAILSHPDQLAYILFTSGSTGRPKGVEVTRGAFANFQASMARAPGLGESDLLLAVTTTMFDIAGLELFLPLSVGASVRIADAETALDGRRLRAVLEREPVTVLQATPATWRMLIETGWAGNKSLRAFVGGEALSRDLADALLSRSSELWNLYGPTETTVWSSLQRIEGVGEILIGRPIDHTQLYILDSQRQLTPQGVTGELCIGGAGVARGYYARPELTGERFVENPYGVPGDRIYRTGDLGRLRDNGDFECLGRLDHQVKIRGFRVELGEIEARLAELDSVRQAVVVVHQERAEDLRIVAYVRPAVDAEFSALALTQALKRSLPAYMLPSQYVCIDEFPLTPNGKVDRKALPTPAGRSSVAEARVRLAPTNATERTLLAIWIQALATTQVGIDDNFFDLGGHSLLAVKIFDRVHQSFGVDLPLAALFETPTIQLLAARIDALASGNGSAARWTTVVPIQPKGFLPPLFCVSGLGGNPMNFTRLAAALGEDQPFYGLQHRGVDGKLPPHTSIRAMAEEFVEHIRELQRHGPYYLAGYSAGGLAAYEMAHVLEGFGEEVALVILFDTFNPKTPQWSMDERLRAHWDNLRARGFSYVRSRLSDGVGRRFREVRRRVRARLAQRDAFRYRLEALSEAAAAAERSYEPAPYGGEVLILQADARLTAGEGIGYRPDETNGWRRYVEGKLEVAQLDCSHIDVMGEAASPLAAAEVRKALARVQRTREVAMANPTPALGSPDALHHVPVPGVATLTRVGI